MTPTLQPGDLLWAGARSTPPQRGDIVLVHHPHPTPRYFVKRIVGLPGEQAKVTGIQLHINNHAMNEPYVDSRAAAQPLPDQQWTLGADEYLVLGDARDDSMDSRRFGPVPSSEISGVMRWRLWPLRRFGRLKSVAIILVSTFLASTAIAQDKRLLAFANRTTLALFVGKFQPGKGWVQPTDFYEPPEVGTAFTIFGATGKLAEVTITDKRQASPDWTPADWTATVSGWPSREQPYALAMQGLWPDTARKAQVISAEEADLKARVAEFLKKEKLAVASPFLTQAFEIDLDGDGTSEQVVTAHNDAKSVREAEPADIYAVALIIPAGKSAVPVVTQTSHKPAHRTLDEHQRAHGTRVFLRWIAFPDVDGDGRQEAALYLAQTSATEVNVFTFGDGKATKVLTGYRQF